MSGLCGATAVGQAERSPARHPSRHREGVGAARVEPCRFVEARTGIELRRCNAAQFVIVYAYLRPTVRYASGVVSIRAVRTLPRRGRVLGGQRANRPIRTLVTVDRTRYPHSGKYFTKRVGATTYRMRRHASRSIGMS